MTNPEPEPIVVTEAMRKAVYAADCERLGHVYVIDTAITYDGLKPTLQGPTEEMLPYLTCGRCTKVWLIIEDEGDDYDDAVKKLKKKVKNPDEVKPRPRKIKEKKTKLVEHVTADGSHTHIEEEIEEPIVPGIPLVAVGPVIGTG